jgi:hypothetical protein
MDGMATSAPTVLVEPDRTGRWIVRRPDEDGFLSRHETATDAQGAARALRGEDATVRVLLRDRYGRIHISAN